MFIFVLQTIWLYISELAGKDLDVWVVLKFLWYVSPRLIPLVLPLTILVTSLMVFGNFSEQYEFAAMKSTGISLQRAMRSLTVFIVLLSVTAFFFANNVIPYSEYKWQNLRRNIAQVSPSMVIAEGQFSQIGDDFNIKVEKKSGDRDQFLENVVIHQKTPSHPNGNYRVIISDNGELASSEGSNTLSLILNDGHYYDDIQVKDPKEQDDQPFVKSYFEQYTINIDLTEFNNADIDKENQVSNHNMYKMSELFVEIDSLSKGYSEDIQAYAANMYYRSGISKFKDTEVRAVKVPDTVESVVEIFPKTVQRNIISSALNNVKGTIQSINAKKGEFQIKTKRLNKHEIALHEKYVLAIACIILFFVGAPLGAIIRKGGMGLPMVVAVLLFLTYHFIGIFAKNSAEDGTMHPFIASWLSTAIMLPLSIWLTYRATTDQGIVDFDSFLQRFRIFQKKKTAELAEGERQLYLTQQERALILSRSPQQLKDILKNYRQYNYSEDMRSAVLNRLQELGYSKEGLKVSGDFENITYTDALHFYEKFSRFSRYALMLYFGILLTVVFYIITVVSAASVANILIPVVTILRILLILAFYFFGIRAMANHTAFYKTIQKKQDLGVWLIFLLLGLAVYVFIHFSFKKNMKEQLEMIR